MNKPEPPDIPAFILSEEFHWIKNLLTQGYRLRWLEYEKNIPKYYIFGGVYLHNDKWQTWLYIPDTDKNETSVNNLKCFESLEDSMMYIENLVKLDLILKG